MVGGSKQVAGLRSQWYSRTQIVPHRWCCFEARGLAFCIPLSVIHWLQDGMSKNHLSKTAPLAEGNTMEKGAARQH